MQAAWQSSSDISQKTQPLFALALYAQLPPYCSASAWPLSCVKPACPGWLAPHQWSPSSATSHEPEAGGASGKGGEGEGGGGEGEGSSGVVEGITK